MAAIETFAARLSIARKLWENRLGKGKQPDRVFAEALDFGPTYLSGLQRSITPPPHDRVLVIAELTGVDAGWLTYGDKTKAPAPSVVKSPRSSIPAKDAIEAQRQAGKGRSAS